MACPLEFFVRARVEGDMERAIPGWEVTETPEADYRCRAWIPHHVVAESIQRSIERIDVGRTQARRKPQRALRRRGAGRVPLKPRHCTRWMRPIPKDGIATYDSGAVAHDFGESTRRGTRFLGWLPLSRNNEAPWSDAIDRTSTGTVLSRDPIGRSAAPFAPTGRYLLRM